MATVAIDPGKTTGIAWTHKETPNMLQLADFTQSEGDLGDVLELKLPADELLELSHSVLAVLEAVDARFGLTTIIVEDFVLQLFNKNRDFLYPVRMLGHLEVLCEQEFRYATFVTKMPHERSVVTPKRMRQWGLWVSGKPHGRAALQHLAAHCRHS